MDWFHSFLYLCGISILAFPIGRILPKHWFRYDAFPFRSFAWEQDGKCYHALSIRQWMHQLPDMSRIMTGCMQMKRKELPKQVTEEDVRWLLDETCVAETVHFLLCVAGMHCMELWQGIGGVIFWVLYVVLCNLPYIVIQRYNRPKLARLYERIRQDDALAEKVHG